MSSLIEKLFLKPIQQGMILITQTHTNVATGIASVLESGFTVNPKNSKVHTIR